MSQVILDIPNETLLALKVSEAEIGEVLRMAAAAKLFEMGRLSSEAAARLAGIPRVVFLARLADYGVDTFKLTEEQLQRETRLVGLGDGASSCERSRFAADNRLRARGDRSAHVGPGAT